MRKILYTIVGAILLGGGGTFLWLYYGGFEGEQGKVVAYIDQYGAYSEIAEQVELLVHLPGTEGNTDRAELLALLESILTKDMEKEKREELARLAYTNLSSIKKEIDAAQIAQARLYEVLQDLDNVSRMFNSMNLRKQASEIVVMARRRAEISARITSILSETNEQTYAIITRILAEKGELSSSHIMEINDATSAAEKRFATLGDLYTELLSKKNEMSEMFKNFATSAT